MDASGRRRIVREEGREERWEAGRMGRGEGRREGWKEGWGGVKKGRKDRTKQGRKDGQKRQRERGSRAGGGRTEGGARVEGRRTRDQPRDATPRDATPQRIPPSPPPVRSLRGRAPERLAALIIGRQARGRRGGGHVLGHGDKPRLYQGLSVLQCWRAPKQIGLKAAIN